MDFFLKQLLFFSLNWRYAGKEGDPILINQNILGIQDNHSLSKIYFHFGHFVHIFQNSEKNDILLLFCDDINFSLI